MTALPGSPIELVREALRRAGSRHSGGNWTCPVAEHDDHHASLSVSEGSDGRALIHCHAGCETKNVIRALDINWADLYVEDRRPERKLTTEVAASSHSERVAEYVYVDRHGEPVARKVRFEPKRFSWEVPDGAGGFRSARAGEGNPRVLFELPAVVDAEVVHIHEGEKSAEAFNKHFQEQGPTGHHATCAPTARWTQELVGHLAQARVVLWVDRDAAGERQAANALALLRAAGIQPEVVRSRDTSPKSDGFDHLKAGHDPEHGEPFDLAPTSESVEKPDSNEADVLRHDLLKRCAPEATSVARLFGPGGELLTPAPRRFLVEGLIAEEVAALLIARGGTGKGFFELMVAVAIATGGTLGPFEVVRPRGVVIVSREDDRAELERRLSVTLRALYPSGVPPEMKSNLIRHLALIDLVGVRGARLSQELADQLVAVTGRLAEPGLIFLDPLGKLLPEDTTGGATLNSQEGAGLVHEWLDVIVRRTACTTFATHHVNKAAVREGKAGGGGTATGSQLLEDLARCVLSLHAVNGELATEMALPDDPAGYVQAESVKTNYTPAFRSPLVFRRATGGALIPALAVGRDEVEDERALRVLEAADGPLRFEDWEKRCREQLDPPMAKQKARNARARLQRRGLVTRAEVREAGRSGAAKILFSPSESAAQRDRMRLQGML